MPVYIGLSVSRCVKDIALGYLDVDDVLNIVGATNFDPSNEKEVQDIIASGDDIFNFPGLKLTEETEESKAILSVPNPKIIMAGSGMSNGGRIIHHEKNYLPNPNDTILLVGYQSAGTLGRLIQEGVKKLHIQSEEIPLRARVEMISGYSGHKDSDHLVEFVSHTAKTLKKVFTVMGEPKAALFLAQKLKDNLGLDTESPKAGDTITLNCS